MMAICGRASVMTGSNRFWKLIPPCRPPEGRTRSQTPKTSASNGPVTKVGIDMPIMATAIAPKSAGRF